MGIQYFQSKYMNVKDILTRTTKLKRIINRDEFNNLCDEFGTSQYKSKLIDTLTNIEKSNYVLKKSS